MGSPEGVGSAEGEEPSEVAGSPEGVGSLGSSGSWTPLPSQLLKCETEMRRRSMYLCTFECMYSNQLEQYKCTLTTSAYMCTM